MIRGIHYNGDPQTQGYRVGNLGFLNGTQSVVISIERFQINGAMAFIPRIRVNFENGHKVEIPEDNMTIYEDDENGNTEKV